MLTKRVSTCTLGAARRSPGAGRAHLEPRRLDELASEGEREPRAEQSAEGEERLEQPRPLGVIPAASAASISAAAASTAALRRFSSAVAKTFSASSGCAYSVAFATSNASMSRMLRGRLVSDHASVRPTASQ